MSEHKDKRIAYTQSKLTESSMIKASSKLSFMLTIDMEESFDWNTPETSAHFSGEIKGLKEFHLQCTKRNIKPLYLVTYQVLKNDIAVDFLLQSLEKKECDIGIHLHSWNTPPIIPTEESFQCNLSQDIEYQKLKNLVELYYSIFKTLPLSHRAGRYGIDITSLKSLSSLGIKMDLSPSAGFDFSTKGGPSFVGVNNHPVWLDKQKNLLTFPVPSALFAKGPDFLINNFRRLSQKLFPSEPVRLSPEGNTVNRMKTLTCNLIDEHINTLVVTVHSTSFEQNENPYSEGPDGVKKVMKTLFNYLDWCQNDMKMIPITPENLWSKYSSTPFNEGK